MDPREVKAHYRRLIAGEHLQADDVWDRVSIGKAFEPIPSDLVGVVYVEVYPPIFRLTGATKWFMTETNVVDAWDNVVSPNIEGLQAAAAAHGGDVVVVDALDSIVWRNF